MPDFNMYTLPSGIGEQAQFEYEQLKKMYPHYSEEMLRSMALSAAGASGKLSRLIYPETQITPSGSDI